jgi:hypothetical protein
VVIIPRELDLRMNALARASSNSNDKPILSSERGCYVRIKTAIVQLKKKIWSLEGLCVKTN